jgi:hypothetical protein
MVLCGDAVFCKVDFDHDGWNGRSDPGPTPERRGRVPTGCSRPHRRVTR